MINLKFQKLSPDNQAISRYRPFVSPTRTSASGTYRTLDHQDFPGSPYSKNNDFWESYANIRECEGRIIPSRMAGSI
jgi:hypothetical protein